MEDDELGSLIKKNLHFVCENSFEHLKKIKENEKPDVIYLDPFFSEEILKKKKKALPPWPIQVLKEIKRSEGENESFKKESQFQKIKKHKCLETTEYFLFQEALKKAKHRVILKRPLRAPAFFIPQVKCHQYKGKLVRYDTYFVGQV